MRKHTHKLLLLACLFVGVISCSDDDDKGRNTPIKKIELTTDIDISKYKGFSFYVGDVEYDYVVNEKKLTATPRDQTYNANTNSSEGSGTFNMSLRAKEKDIDRKDQSTFEKLLSTDEIVWIGSTNKDVFSDGVISSNLASHNGSFVSFAASLPANATITIMDQGKLIRPYIQPGVHPYYNYIATNGSSSSILVKIGDKEYSIPIKQQATKADAAAVTATNTFYYFTLAYNANNIDNPLSLDHFQERKWVNQHFEQSERVIVTPIKKIEATTDIDLSRYQDRICYVGDLEYNYTIQGNKLTATPKSDDQIYNSVYDRGVADVGTASLSLIPKNADENESDQSSFEKLFAQDDLRWSVSDQAPPSIITDAELWHGNNYAKFTTVNLPEGATIEIRSNYSDLSIKPYIKDGTYNFIHHFATNFSLIVRISNQEYTVPIKNTTRLFFETSFFYTFELKYDANNKDNPLSITSLKEEKWINQHFE